MRRVASRAADWVFHPEHGSDGSRIVLTFGRAELVGRSVAASPVESFGLRLTSALTSAVQEHSFQLGGICPRFRDWRCRPAAGLLGVEETVFRIGNVLNALNSQISRGAVEFSRRCDHQVVQASLIDRQKPLNGKGTTSKGGWLAPARGKGRGCPCPWPIWLGSRAPAHTRPARTVRECWIYPLRPAGAAEVSHCSK
jgi:hypothetical protein